MTTDRCKFAKEAGEGRVSRMQCAVCTVHTAMESAALMHTPGCPIVCCNGPGTSALSLCTLVPSLYNSLSPFKLITAPEVDSSMCVLTLRLLTPKRRAYDRGISPLTRESLNWGRELVTEAPINKNLTLFLCLLIKNSVSFKLI
jgi:hypothetical protein